MASDNEVQWTTFLQTRLPSRDSWRWNRLPTSLMLLQSLLWHALSPLQTRGMLSLLCEVVVPQQYDNPSSNRLAWQMSEQ